MGVYHLISINEDQLRSWLGEHDDLLTNLGAAVVLACLDPGTCGVTIQDDSLQSTGGGNGSSISVSHIDQHEGDDFAAWAWTAGDSVGLADLPKGDLETLSRLVETVRSSRAGNGAEVADHP